MKNLQNRNGSALIFVMMFFMIAAWGLTSLGQLGASHARTASLSVDSTQALYLTEAAIEQAKLALRNDFSTTGDSADFAFQGGEYYYNVSDDPGGDPTKKVITGYGGLPNLDDAEVARAVEVVIEDPSALIPANFGDYAIWTASSLTTNGNSYTVTGSTIAGSGYSMTHDRVSGSQVTDASINPLFEMDYAHLRQIAQSQGYLFTTASPPTSGTVPTDFYNVDPDPLDPADLGTPNVVYIEGTSMAINYNVGGFIVAVGDILNNESATCNVSISGNRTVDGVIYTRGSFTLNGGGNGKNVNGGIYTQNAVTLNGGVIVTHVAAYQNAIEGMLTAEDMEVLSWNEIEYP